MEDLAYVTRVGVRREPGKPPKLELVDKHEHTRNVEVPSDRGVDTSNNLFLSKTWIPLTPLTKKYKISRKLRLQAVKSARTVFALVIGIAVGLCGVSGYIGFLGFLFSQALVTGWVVLGSKGNLHDVLLDTSMVTYQGIFAPLLEYILVWTVAHNFVHVYT